MWSDPWFVSMVIVLMIMLLVTAVALLPNLRDMLILAMALPQALFKKAFGDPPGEDGHH